jgi:putative membrane protein
MPLRVRLWIDYLKMHYERPGSGEGESMTLEAVLATIHIAGHPDPGGVPEQQAALCRPEWMNAAVVQRLARLDLIYGIAAVVLLLTGVARVLWGAKGMGWYVSQPLFHLKMTLFVLAALMSIKPTIDFRRWARPCRPSAAAAGRCRAPHTPLDHVAVALMPVIAVIAVFWARGWWRGTAEKGRCRAAFSGRDGLVQVVRAALVRTCRAGSASHCGDRRSGCC